MIRGAEIGCGYIRMLAGALRNISIAQFKRKQPDKPWAVGQLRNVNMRAEISGAKPQSDRGVYGKTTKEYAENQVSIKEYDRSACGQRE